jgi:hypothetical protein
VATRSFQLAMAALAQGESRVLYTVPAETTVIIKSVICYNATAAVASLYVTVKPGPAAAATLLNLQTQAGQTAVLELWLVIRPGTQVSAVNGAQGVLNVAVSGAQLPGVV